MNALTRRDLKAAMLVSPILALGGYVAADHALAEKPQAAEKGQSYRLAAMSNCRYESGRCTLRNGDVRLELGSQRDESGVIHLTLTSPLAIEMAVLAYSGGGRYSQPETMRAKSKESNHWVTRMVLRTPKSSSLRLAVTIQGSNYYVETTAIFVDQVFGFSQENIASNSRS